MCFVPIWGFLSLSVLKLGTRETDRQTDRHRPSFQPRGRDIIIVIVIIIIIYPITFLTFYLSVSIVNSEYVIPIIKHANNASN